MSGIRQSEQIDAICAAIVALQGELEPVTKDKENPFFKSKYADLGSVVEASKELRATHGLGIVQLPSFDGEHDLLTTRIIHSSGQWLEASMRLHLTKDDPQGQGSALTYARRYSYGGALGIVTEDDDDGNQASPRKPKVPKETAWQAQVRKTIEGLSDSRKAALKAWWPSDLPPVGRLSQTEAAQVLGQIAELIQGKEGPKDTPASDDRGGGTSATAPEPEPAVTA